MKILIIEDDLQHRENFKKAITNHEIIFPPFPFPALEEMQELISKSGADLVLLDIQLGMNYTGNDLYPTCCSAGKKCICISSGIGGGFPGAKSWRDKQFLTPILANPEHPRSKAKLQELLDLIESKWTLNFFASFSLKNWLFLCPIMLFFTNKSVRITKTPYFIKYF